MSIQYTVKTVGRYEKYMKT